MSSNKRRIVPQSIEELETLVQEVMDDTEQYDRELVTAVVCQAIQNTPKDEDHISISYLSAIIKKYVCRAICRDKLLEINKNLTEKNKQILEKNWIIAFNSDPNDMQARDELQRLADAGSDKAKQCLGDAYVSPIAPPPQEPVTQPQPTVEEGTLA